MSVLAVDVGTTMIKSVVFDDRGRETAVSRQATEVHRPHPGWAEQDMTAVWHAVVTTVHEALAESACPVRLLAFTAQGDGVWLVDAQGRPTGPAVLWSDGRAGDLLDRWQADGVLDEAFRRNGSLTCSGMPNAILRWFARHDPDRLERSSTALTAAGWLFLRLTGATAVDESDASAPFLDHATGDYDPRLIALFGLEPYRRLLPEVLGEAQRTAGLAPGAAGLLGLPTGLPVVMAPYDIVATARGVGVVDPGQACGILGTTLCTEIVRGAVDTTGEPCGVTIAGHGPGNVLRAFPTLNGIEVLEWAARILGLSGPPELAQLAFRAGPGARRPMFLPYLSPAGERAPFLDPHARGAFWGLSLDHTRADLARAVFDGLSLVLRDSLAASRTDVSELRLCGGGANSDAWCRLIADVTGVPTARSGDTELGAKGAFLTGLVLTGDQPDLHSAVRAHVRMRDGWEPDPGRARLGDDLYEDFLRWRSLARDAGWQPRSTTSHTAPVQASVPASPGPLNLRPAGRRAPEALEAPKALETLEALETRPPEAPMPDRTGHDPGSVWLGLDLGTQSARCVAVDGTGGILAAAARPLDSRRDGVRHEQDPEQWWNALAAACRDALAGLDPGRVRGLAVDGTSGTVLLADARGTPLTPGLMYDDGRAADQAVRADEAGAKVWRELGYRSMQPSWALPKLLWLLEHESAAGAPGTRLLHQPDLITWRLTGHQVAADASHALKTGYHLVQERWPLRELDRLGVPAGILPRVVRPGRVLGGVCAAAARATGIPEGTAVVAGMTDGCAAQIGAGSLEPGAWNSVLGTTLVLKGSSPHLVRDPAGVVYCHRSPDGNWLPGGASSSGAGVLAQRFSPDELAPLTARAQGKDWDAVAYPLAAASGGERFPFRAPDAVPFVLGETPTRAEEFHACLLGVACVERLCFDYLDHLGAPVDGPLTLSGGGTRNPYWTRLRAEVTGRTVRVPVRAESAVGMAVLAATSGGTTLREAAAAMVRTGPEIVPDPRRTARYLPAYLRFVDHLARRGWLAPAVADHARGRAAP